MRISVLKMHETLDSIAGFKRAYIKGATIKWRRVEDAKVIYTRDARNSRADTAYARCYGKHDNGYIADSLLKTIVKEYRKSVNVRQTYAQM